MGLVASRLTFMSLLAATALAFGAVDASAADYDFSVSPSPPNQGQPATFSLVPESAVDVTVSWDLEGGEFEVSGRTMTHTFEAAGPVTVRMRVVDGEGKRTTVTKEITVNGMPAAAFGFSPAQPLTGEDVAFNAVVTDPENDLVALGWDFGDGAHSSVSEPSHSFAAPGTYDVVLTATDEHGAVTRVTHQVTVTGPVLGPEQPPPSSEPGGTDPGGTNPGASDPGTAPITPKPPAPPAPMHPVPVVRIAGIVLPHGALVKVLSVRAPRGASVLVRCRGRGCPARAVARSTGRSLLRFHRFERRLRAGVMLELFVRKRGRLGKYTRFRIRAGNPPARVDRCLMPGSNRPVRCT
jgi:PKD repeat protein